MKLEWVVVAFGVGLTTAAIADVPAKEKDWRKHLEDYANGTAGDRSGNTLADDHKEVTAKCGHDIKVSFEWSTFHMDTWDHPNLGSPAVCAGNNQLEELSSACEGSSGFGPSQAAAVKKIKTITCHYKACAKLPDPVSGAKGSNLQATEFQYKLTKKGSNLDETFCENSANMGGSALINFLKKI